MRRALLACAIMLAPSCARPEAPRSAAPTATPREAQGVLEKLAREIDPGPQPPIWPQVPADVRARVEIDAPRDKAPIARLAAARERLAAWSLRVSTYDPSTLAPQLQRAFEGVYLAEPLTAGTDVDPTALEARALLWNFYNGFIGTQPLLRSFEDSWGRAAGTKLGTSMQVAELIASAGAKMADRLAVDLLRARAPGYAIEAILWTHGSRKLRDGEVEGGRALYAELVRRIGSGTTRQDWLRIAHAYTRLEDPQAATDAIRRAKAAAAPGDLVAAAAARAAERDRDTLVRLLALPSDRTPASALARVDLLLALDRTKEAESVLEALARERPKDARVRARAVQIRLRHGEFTDRLVDVLRGDDLTDRNGEYWSMRAGAAGMAIAKSTPTRASLAEVATAAKELAADDPGRAAVLSFLVERVSAMLDGNPDAAAFVRAMRASFDGAVAIRANFPATSDADRVVLALALFAAEPARGLEAALVRPKTVPADDPELYLQRANTIVTLAAYAGKTADLARAREAVQDVFAAEPEAEGTREALLGDLDALAAVNGERAAWGRAVVHYDAARKKAKADRARLENNLGLIAALEGDAARATAHYEAAGREKSGRLWVPLLNQATAPGSSKDTQLAAIRTIAGPADAQLPALLNMWRASLEPGASDAALAASKAIAELDAPLSLHKVALHTRGLETEGTFSLALGLRSGRLSHALSASAYATLWLVRPIPLTRAELEAKAKPKTAAPPAGRR
jgi:hypothetical protein